MAPTEFSAFPEFSEFDAFGVPSGPAAAEFWRRVASTVLSEVERDGWDQPHAVFALLTPVETEAVTGGQVPDTVDRVDLVVGREPGPGQEQVTTGYLLTQIASAHAHPKELLPGLTAQPGTAALILVTEAWTVQEADPDGWEDLSQQEQEDALHRIRVTDDNRPSTHADRVEARQAFIMQPDGSCWMFNYTRGQDPSDPDALTDLRDGADGARVLGVVPDLMRRVFGLPVEYHVPPKEVLGRAALALTLGLVGQQPIPAVVAVSIVVAQIIDGLDMAPGPDETGPGGFVAVGPFTRDLREMAASGAFGPLLRAGRGASRLTWDEFLAKPGADRWLTQDENDEPLTDESRAWYGIGHLARFVDETFPSFSDLVAALVDTVGEGDAAEVMEMLGDVGWLPRDLQP